MPTHAANARQAAFAALHASQFQHGFVNKLLDDVFDRSSLSVADRRLATEITYGAVRRRATLDAIIQPHVSRPRSNVEPELWTLLQLGTYQLVFLNSIPPHAAVHETVELTRWLNRPQWSGFLNGVLRSIERMLTGETVAEPNAGVPAVGVAGTFCRDRPLWRSGECSGIAERDRARSLQIRDSLKAVLQPAADAVPLAEGRYRKLASAVFADPSVDPTGYFADAFSFPRWLVDRWQQRFEFDELVRLGFWFNAPAGISLRVNRLRTTRDELLTAFAAAGVEAHPGQCAESIHLDAPARIDDLPGFREGWFVVQDESAMQAARLLNPQPGQTVLDLCAAPGTKTTHLAELMGNRGRILATDVSADRLARVTENCQRLGVEIVETAEAAGLLSVQPDGRDIPPGPFDAILVDVPCSNTGVLGKRPDARWRIEPKDLEELPRLQTQLLLSAIGRLAPGGRLVYSTCSIEPEENEQVVRAVLGSLPGLELETEIHHLPGQPADGGYQALVVATTPADGKRQARGRR